MTISELLKRIAAAYPGFDTKAAETWAPVFRARLDKHAGEALQDACVAVLAGFKPTTRQPFPIPFDFEAHLPGKLDLPSSGPSLDVKGHGERKRHLMAEWRSAQGERGAGGVPEVLRALEHIAGPIADAQAWTRSEAPLRLTKTQLRLAQHRAISQRRRVEYGPPGRDPEAWWEQIAGIAARWGIRTTREEWETTTPERRQAA